MVADVRRFARLQLGNLPIRSRKTKTPGPGVFANVGGDQPAGEGMRELCKPAQSGEQNVPARKGSQLQRRALKEPPNEVMRLESAGESTSRSESCQQQPPHSV